MSSITEAEVEAVRAGCLKPNCGYARYAPSPVSDEFGCAKGGPCEFAGAILKALRHIDAARAAAGNAGTPSDELVALRKVAHAAYDDYCTASDHTRQALIEALRAAGHLRATGIEKEPRHAR